MSDDGRTAPEGWQVPPAGWQAPPPIPPSSSLAPGPRSGWDQPRPGWGSPPASDRGSYPAPPAGWGGGQPWGWPPPQPAKRRGLPGWAIALIVIGVVVFVAGVVLAAWGCSRVVAEIDKEEAALAGGREIDAAILAYAADHDGAYPSPAEVGPHGDVAGYADGWPENPFSGGPMEQGTGPGDFVYSLEPSATGKPYTLSVYLSPWSPPPPTPI